MRGSKALLILSSLVVHIDIDVVLLRRVESRLYLWVSVSTLSMSTWVCRSIMYVLLYIVYILCGVWWLRVLHPLSVLELLCMIRYDHSLWTWKVVHGGYIHIFLSLYSNRYIMYYNCIILCGDWEYRIGRVYFSCCVRQGLYHSLWIHVCMKGCWMFWMLSWLSLL